MTKKVSKSVWFSMEPEAGRWPEIWLLDVGSVGEPACGGWNHLQFDPAENWIAPYFQLSPSSHYTTFGFSFSVLVQVRRIFYWQYLWSFGFLPTFPHQVLDFFHRLILLSGFLPQSSSLGWEVFHQWHNFLRLISFPTGLGCSHWSPGFPPQSFVIGLGGFLPGYTHTYTYMFDGAHV